MSEINNTNAFLRVSTHVLIQLGRELVTDTEQAILECVKNAYDADSPLCLINVDTKIEDSLIDYSEDIDFTKFLEESESVYAQLEDPKVTNKRILKYKGKITIEDRGDGLTADKIKSSWLVISTSIKRSETDKPKIKTRLGRTPLGDKGLGRLSTMKLGDILLIESATSPENEIHSARFRWTDCEVAETIDKIPVLVEKRPNTERFKGTRVSILGLNDRNYWEKNTRIFELSQSLMKLISPFEATSSFPVAITIDGNSQALTAIGDELFKRAVADFSFEWKEDESNQPYLEATAKIKKQLYVSSRGNESRQIKIDTVFTPDDGKSFLKYLQKAINMRRFEWVENDNPNYFLILKERIYWNEIIKDKKDVNLPGEFSGNFYFFHIDINDEELDVSGLKFNKDIVKNMSGISILRDGFLIRSNGDWLNLSASATSGSIYHMRPKNTIGYFALSGEKNYKLTEKSDREGFIENDVYRGFLIIAERCKKFANDCLNNTRRGLDDLYKEYLDQNEIKASKIINKPALERLEDSVKSQEKTKIIAKTASNLLRDEFYEFKDEISQLTNTNEILAKVEKLTNVTLESMDQIHNILDEQPLLKEAIAKVKNDIEISNEQKLSLYESAAVGLSARGLAHEMRTHLTEIRMRMNNIQKLSKIKNVSENDFTPELRAVRSACASMTNTIGLIDPMLPRARRIKSNINLLDFLNEYINSRAYGFDFEKIEIILLNTEKALTIRCNLSRLLQVIDNIIRNSVYWLRRSDSIFNIKIKKEIFIEFTNSGLIIWDTGIGIDKKVENNLFEMFVSAKPEDSNDGQGLGLFISQQLLRDEECDIRLLSERNTFGNMYKFFVDFSGIVL
ncbi:sensor histidine kinase [Acinetobacter geminorum]|uniref:sensor histidine kinase n=1 Tax=Acinetobacter geminorum TaxID=2730922 RepID=UPI003AF7D448